MIGARLAPSLPPGPDLLRGPRGDVNDRGPTAVSDAGRGLDSSERADRADRSERSTGGSAQPERTGRDTETAGSRRASGAERRGRPERRDEGRGPGREDADAFERMVDRDGTHAADAERASTAVAGAADSPAPQPTGNAPKTPDAHDALPAQLLAMLSTFAPATAASDGTAAGTAGTGLQGAGPTPVLPTLNMPVRPAAGAAHADATLSATNAVPATGAANATGTAAALAALLPGTAETATPGPLAETGAGFDALLREAPDPASLTLPATAPVTASRTAAVPQLAPVALPADPQAGFDDGFGSRIVWMAEQRLGHADIRVTPEHLGTIDVRLQLDGAKVSAEFYSAQPEVRQALEASFGRLRDLLGQHGLELSQADVGQRRSGQHDAPRGDGPPPPTDAEPAAAAPAVIRKRLLDEIA